MGLLAAALFTGVLLGRMSGDSIPDDHIFLNETTPPTAAQAAPQTTPRKAQPQAERIPRQATTTIPRGKTDVRPTKSPTGEIAGFTDGDPVRVLGDDQSLRSMPGMAADVVRLTNAARAKNGCRPLKTDARLTRAARTHSMEMARSGQFTHESPDGASPWDRMERAGYHNGTAENIGRGYASAQEAVRGWLASPDHRRNMLNCDFNAIGVGVVSGPGGPWWTQDFGRS
ncbi:CAP domain-containing protein [Nonomuraea sp. NPDC048826]|uniref:CAP domain-containing protein n=1 Tax=Nonomuraea sp. NPDC048826 TaxID=3364347 RepID=UPI0037108109